jgi:hypothetical protein
MDSFMLNNLRSKSSNQPGKFYENFGSSVAIKKYHPDKIMRRLSPEARLTSKKLKIVERTRGHSHTSNKYDNFDTTVRSSKRHRYTTGRISGGIAKNHETKKLKSFGKNSKWKSMLNNLSPNSEEKTPKTLKNLQLKYMNDEQKLAITKSFEAYNTESSDHQLKFLPSGISRIFGMKSSKDEITRPSKYRKTTKPSSRSLKKAKYAKDESPQSQYVSIVRKIQKEAGKTSFFKELGSGSKFKESQKSSKKVNLHLKSFKESHKSKFP